MADSLAKRFKNALTTAFSGKSQALVSQELLDAISDLYRTRSSPSFSRDVDAAYALPKIRRYRYEELDRMIQKAPSLGAVLEQLALDATRGEVVVKSSDSNIKKELNQLFARIELDSWITGQAYDLAKYGDDILCPVFGGNKIGKENPGIVGVRWIHPGDVKRVEDDSGRLLGFEVSTGGGYTGTVDDSIKNNGPKIKPWELVHFRVRFEKSYAGESNASYGTSLIARAYLPASRKDIFSRLFLVFRILSTIDRILYPVDVGMADPVEQVSIMQKWSNWLLHNVYRNRRDGRYLTEIDPFTFSEAVIWPYNAEGRGEKPQRLPGPNVNIKEAVDYDHVIKEMFSSVGASPAFFGYGGDRSSVETNKTLSSQDIKFSRRAALLQRGLHEGLRRLCQIHLAVRGFPHDRITAGNAFTLEFEPPSSLEEMERMDAFAARIDVADKINRVGRDLGLDETAWTEYVLRNVLHLSDSEIRKLTSKESPMESDGEKREIINKTLYEEVDELPKSESFRKESPELKGKERWER